MFYILFQLESIYVLHLYDLSALNNVCYFYSTRQFYCEVLTNIILKLLIKI